MNSYIKGTKESFFHFYTKLLHLLACVEDKRFHFSSTDLLMNWNWKKKSYTLFSCNKSQTFDKFKYNYSERYLTAEDFMVVFLFRQHCTLKEPRQE